MRCESEGIDETAIVISSCSRLILSRRVGATDEPFLFHSPILVDIEL